MSDTTREEVVTWQSGATSGTDDNGVTTIIREPIVTLAQLEAEAREHDDR